ncbi:UbiX family flavin prenyltransferase [Candidatus Obscuribacterales bacterium]|nr:UbiX family flavin prenyltransferase [Candidatus Obscuribacterales bacterium]MBX3136623.1 UbiX family flavin prenyltransferase [Candidatus Obscuribacterales bacterium]MBX3150555.1 UbiX family flavin prenyltransferase [Candidatus Obscuribacterales bacterium]
MSEKKTPFVLGITGASGVIYGLRMLQYLLSIEQPVELVMSKAALRVMKEEHDLVLAENDTQGLLRYLELPENAPIKHHYLMDYGASVSSGSYKTLGMAILPCSIGTLGALANGLTENLVHRAAAVCLKERRKLVVVVREMPFGHIQLKNMVALSEAGAIVSCASPGFYHRPESVSDQIDFVVGRVLDQFDFDNALFKRWKQDAAPIVTPQRAKTHE